jgi:transcriptional regulator with XRE-family HTH domain
MSEMPTAATSLRERIAEEIRVLLARRRISASELARQIGATQPYISRRLTGETAFDVDDLEKIAACLDVEVADLLPVPTPGRLLTTVGTPTERPNVHSDSSAVGPARTRPARKSNPIGRPRRDTTAPASAVPPTQRRPALVSGPGQRIAA